MKPFVPSLAFLSVLVLLTGCQAAGVPSGGTKDQDWATVVRDREVLLSTKGQLEGRIQDLEKQLSGQEASLELLRERYRSLEEERALLQNREKLGKDDLRTALDKALGEKERLKSENLRLETEKLAMDRKSHSETTRLDSSAQELNRMLEAEVQRGDVEVVRFQNVLLVNIKDSLLFDPDSPSLLGGHQKILSAVAKAFQGFPDKVIRVEGHTASGPSRWPTTWDLGAARAVSVVRYFQETLNIDPARLVALSFGEYRPLASNSDEKARALNRRVELVLVDRPLYQVQELISSR